jgi:hypothetical protein
MRSVDRVKQKSGDEWKTIVSMKAWFQKRGIKTQEEMPLVSGGDNIGYVDMVAAVRGDDGEFYGLLIEAKGSDGYTGKVLEAMRQVQYYYRKRALVELPVTRWFMAVAVFRELSFWERRIILDAGIGWIECDTRDGKLVTADAAINGAFLREYDWVAPRYDGFVRMGGEHGEYGSVGPGVMVSFSRTGLEELVGGTKRRTTLWVAPGGGGGSVAEAGGES